MSVFSNDPKVRADDKYRDHVRRGEFEQAKLQRDWYAESSTSPLPTPTRPDRIGNIAWNWRQLGIETCWRGVIDEDTWNELRRELVSYNPVAFGQSLIVRHEHAAYLRRLAARADIVSLYGPAVWATSSINYSGIVRMLREVAEFLEDDTFAWSPKP